MKLHADSSAFSLRSIALASVLGFSFIGFAKAQTPANFPTKPLHVVVPFAPGAADVFIRALGPALEAELGQPIVVENRPGANGLIGADAVKRGTADGYTLLFAPVSVVTTRYVKKDVTLDVCKDFSAISTIHESPMVLVASPNLGVKTVAELIDLAKKNPGKLTYASAGIGSIQQLSAETFKRESNTDLVHIPYNGGTVFIPDLMTGRVDVAFSTLGTLAAQIADKKLVPLAVLGNSTLKDLPGVPSITDTLPAFQKVAAWSAILAPAGLSEPTQNRLHQVISKALAHPDIRASFEKNFGVALASASPAEVTKLICSESDRLEQLTKEIGIVPN